LFEFQVRRPGHFFFLKADFAKKRVNVRQAEVNVWGMVKALHAFTGVQMDAIRGTGRSLPFGLIRWMSSPPV
ncbi:MAG TPA: hypothetical protein VGR78_08755, partial [Verrucomicrobiae bacterium]|nr:hypothetical protein [Verrucomicrobiae bacterium]